MAPPCSLQMAQGDVMAMAANEGDTGDDAGLASVDGSNGGGRCWFRDRQFCHFPGKEYLDHLCKLMFFTWVQ